MNCLLCLLVTCAVASVLTNNHMAVAVPTKVKLLKDVDKFVRAKPDATITKFDTPRKGRDKHTKHYVKGERVPGDRLVLYETDSFSFESLQSVAVPVIYPIDSDYGAVVSYVNVSVNQTSELGDAFFVYGGIGEREIGFIISAVDTNKLSYIVEIYGV